MIFNKKAGFYSSNLNYYIIQVRNGDLCYLPWIFCVLLENSPKHKLIAAKILDEVLKEISFDEICRTDEQMRETISREWDIDWNSLSINDFITNQMSEDEKRAVFIFATFNPNGFIREQAIQSLANYKNALSFILLRCNDWVYQVRKAALNLLPQMLSRASDEEVVNALPFMEKLRRSGRCEFDHIYSIFANVFQANKNLIKQGLTSNDIRARRFCISTFHDLHKANVTLFMEHIPYERDPFLRKMIFQLLIKQNVSILELSNDFIHDKYPQNRFLALQYLYSNTANQALDTAIDMLMDKNAKVRELARSIVVQCEENFDIHQHYFDNLNGNTAISIYGLSEVGCREDCVYIEPFLLDTSISIVRASMTALMHFDSDRYIPKITEMLATENHGIVKTATQLLKKNRNYDFEKVLKILDNSADENIKIKCASLLFLAGKWKSLIYILILIDDRYENLENLCQAQIKRWIVSYNRSFAILSENDKQTIVLLLNKKMKLLKPETVKQILFFIK